MSRKQQLKQSEEDEEQKKRKRYLRKLGLRERYGNICEKTVDRYRRKGRIPEPDFYINQIPFWSEDRLDEADLKAMKESLTPELNHGLKEYRDRKSKADRKTAKESLRA
jgi:hypothetical protein